MGDAGPSTPLPEVETQIPAAEQQPREIHVLVTGFGPFKSFTTNPSWLIASSLPTSLEPLLPSESSPKDSAAHSSHPHHPFSSLKSQLQEINSHTQPLRPPSTKPYTINIHTYPDPVRVAYTPTATLVPSLLNPATNPSRLAYDYILHIGLASGRDSYTLETLAHRSEYLIPDVDDGIGNRISDIWRRENVPEVLHVGWEPQDVLRRWEAEVARRLDDTLNAKTADEGTGTQLGDQRSETGPGGTGGGVREWMASHGMLLRPASYSSAMPMAGTSRRPQTQKKAVVKLSRDAGRFLCEFILMCSLVQRYLEATSSSSSSNSTPAAATAPAPSQPDNDGPAPPGLDSHSQAREKLGKVAFLHVPNGIDKTDVALGRMVAESAIRSLVASWEAGYRNPIVYRAVDSGAAVESGKEVGAEGVGAVAGRGFEDRGTGDAVS